MAPDEKADRSQSSLAAHRCRVQTLALTNARLLLWKRFLPWRPGGHVWELPLLLHVRTEQHTSLPDPTPLSVHTKELYKVPRGFRIPRAEEGEQWHCLGFASPVCPLVLLQLRLPAYGQLQLLADHLDLLLQLGEFLHHRVPS